MKFRKLINITRPRFWIYVLGPFLLGLATSGDVRLLSGATLVLLIFLFVFFTVPANLLIYGVNDIFDYETDKLNPKKVEYEELVTPQEQSFLWKLIAILVIPFLLTMIWLPTAAKVALLVFLFTGVFYSAKPIRAKVNPPLDIIFSSIIYISPAVIGFFAATGMQISWLAVVGGLLWASAMQTYSAIPDIDADTQAGVKTLATLLGQKGALWFCLLSYLAATLIGFLFLGWLGLVIGLVYVVLMIMSFKKPHNIFHYYTYFPKVNSLAGFIIFWFLVLGFVLV